MRILICALFAGLLPLEANGNDSLSMSLVPIGIEGDLIPGGSGDLVGTETYMPVRNSVLIRVWDMANPVSPVLERRVCEYVRRSMQKGRRLLTTNGEVIVSDWESHQSGWEGERQHIPVFETNWWLSIFDSDGRHRLNYREMDHYAVNQPSAISLLNRNLYSVGVFSLLKVNLDHIDNPTRTHVVSEFVEMVSVGEYVVHATVSRGISILGFEGARDSLITLFRSNENEMISRQNMIEYNDLLVSNEDSRTVVFERVLGQEGLDRVQQISLPDTIQGEISQVAFIRNILFIGIDNNLFDGWLLAYDFSELEHPRLVGYYSGPPIWNMLAAANGNLFVSAHGNIYFVEMPEILSAELKEIVPADYSFDVYPNPFNSTLFIHYSMPYTGASNLRIFNQSGQTLHSGLVRSSGSYSWNAAGFPSGLYFVELNSGHGIVTKPITLLK